MNDIGVNVKEVLKTKDGMGTVGKWCCPKCEEFYRQVIVEKNWVCPFCGTKVSLKR